MKLIVAHRGDTSAAHENTLDAFRAAIAHGASGIEFDVHVTADRVAVVHHDEDIAGRTIAAMSYSDLTKLRVGYQVPTLSEVLDVTAGRLRLDVEIKAPGCEREVMAQLANTRVAFDDLFVTAFEAATLDRVRAIEPRVRTGWLVEKMSSVEALEAFRRSGAAFLAPHHAIVDEAMLREAERLQVPLLPWTVNDTSRMRALLRSPAVMGLITDRVVDGLAARRPLRDVS